MEDEESLNFCTNCGAPLRESDTFCTACGSALGESAAGSSTQNRQYPGKKNNTLLILGVLSGIWAIIALYMGLSIVISLDSMMDEIVRSDVWSEISEMISYEELRTILLSSGYLIVVSGILSVVTAVLCIMKRLYIVALITCIIASIFALLFLVGILGLIVAFFIYKNKKSFIEHSTTV